MPPVRFELTISAGGWPQTYPIDLEANDTGIELSNTNPPKKILIDG